MVLQIDFALWALLAVVWLVAAPFSHATVRREPLGSRLRYLLPAALFAFALRFGAPFAPWVMARFIPATWWSGVVSVALTALGIAFALWARAALGRNWSGTVTVKEGHALIQDGPYAIARHPIYTGAVIALVGTMIGAGTVVALLGVAAVVVALRSKMAVEERFMTEEFGQAYADYRRRVKKLVPFVW